MIRLEQKLNLDDDSFTYTVVGEDAPRYRVNSAAALTEFDAHIGQFKLRYNQWHLYLGDILFMSGPPNGLFKLPEFELKALTALVNQKQPSAL